MQMQVAVLFFGRALLFGKIDSVCEQQGFRGGDTFTGS